MRKELENLAKQLESPESWNAPERMSHLMRDKRRYEALLEEVHTVETMFDELDIYLELKREGESVETEWKQQVEKIQAALERLETRVLLSEEDDPNPAILEIHAGAGGTEAQDWVEMLLRMYLRWAERQGFKTQVVDILPGEEAGLKRVTVIIEGPYAYGLLKSETGVHRLVRISPFDANRRRHTSFASVFVIPEVEESVEVEINPADLKIETFRAGGHGGQHVNVTDSAIRITHLPTGIVAQCQNERSQHQNRRMAMQILMARLYEHYKKEKEAAFEEKFESAKTDISWGHQIRSYVLYPYQMVKDHRTGHEEHQAEKVLDGEILDRFISAYLVEHRKMKSI